MIKSEKVLKSSFCKTSPEWWTKALAQVDDLPGEEWRKFRNTFYSVSNLGRVKRNRGEKVINGKIVFYEEKLLNPCLKFNKDNKRWEYTIVLMVDGKRKHFRVSRLVAECFIPNDDPDHKTQVNHKNENTLDNRAINLEHCTPEYNSNYGTRNERISKTRKMKKELKTA